jgi:ankyrin repeat protein
VEDAALSLAHWAGLIGDDALTDNILKVLDVGVRSAAEPGRTSVLQRTALHYAAYSGNSRTAIALLDHLASARNAVNIHEVRSCTAAVRIVPPDFFAPPPGTVRVITTAAAKHARIQQRQHRQQVQQERQAALFHSGIHSHVLPEKRAKSSAENGRAHHSFADSSAASSDSDASSFWRSDSSDESGLDNVSSVSRQRMAVVRVQTTDRARTTNVLRAGNDGPTPLHLAAWFGHTDVTKALLDRGAVPSLVARIGWSDPPSTNAHDIALARNALLRARSGKLGADRHMHDVKPLYDADVAVRERLDRVAWRLLFRLVAVCAVFIALVVVLWWCTVEPAERSGSDALSVNLLRNLFSAPEFSPAGTTDAAHVAAESVDPASNTFALWMRQVLQTIHLPAAVRALPPLVRGGFFPVGPFYIGCWSRDSTDDACSLTDAMLRADPAAVTTQHWNQTVPAVLELDPLSAVAALVPAGYEAILSPTIAGEVTGSVNVESPLSLQTYPIGDGVYYSIRLSPVGATSSTSSFGLAHFNLTTVLDAWADRAVRPISLGLPSAGDTVFATSQLLYHPRSRRLFAVSTMFEYTVTGAVGATTAVQPLAVEPFIKGTWRYVLREVIVALLLIAGLVAFGMVVVRSVPFVSVLLRRARDGWHDFVESLQLAEDDRQHALRSAAAPAYAGNGLPIGTHSSGFSGVSGISGTASSSVPRGPALHPPGDSRHHIAGAPRVIVSSTNNDASLRSTFDSSDIYADSITQAGGDSRAKRKMSRSERHQRRRAKIADAEHAIAAAESATEQRPVRAFLARRWLQLFGSPPPVAVVNRRFLHRHQQHHRNVWSILRRWLIDVMISIVFIIIVTFVVAFHYQLRQAADAAHVSDYVKQVQSAFSAYAAAATTASLDTVFPGGEVFSFEILSRFTDGDAGVAGTPANVTRELEQVMPRDLLAVTTWVLKFRRACAFAAFFLILALLYTFILIPGAGPSLGFLRVFGRARVLLVYCAMFMTALAFVVFMTLAYGSGNADSLSFRRGYFNQFISIANEEIAISRDVATVDSGSFEFISVVFSIYITLCLIIVLWTVVWNSYDRDDERAMDWWLRHIEDQYLTSHLGVNTGLLGIEDLPPQPAAEATAGSGAGSKTSSSGGTDYHHLHHDGAGVRGAAYNYRAMDTGGGSGTGGASARGRTEKLLGWLARPNTNAPARLQRWAVRKLQRRAAQEEERKRIAVFDGESEGSDVGFGRRTYV